MKPGDLRRFRNSLTIIDGVAVGTLFEGSTFMVLEVFGTAGWEPPRVDIFLDGRCENDLGFHWVRDNSEPLNGHKGIR